MSSVQCWDCGETFTREEVFDIPVFRKGWTIKWCFNCAMKQLEWSDYRLIPKPEKYKKFKVKSSEDNDKVYRVVIEELILCFEKQFRKLEEIDDSWGPLQDLAIEIVWGKEEDGE